MRLTGNRTRLAWRRTQTTVIVLVAAMLCIPPLVRATGRLIDSPTTVLRLNRGFDAPQTKQTVDPPPTRAVPSYERPEPGSPRSVAAVHAFDEVIPDRLHDLSPDPLRGPPLS